MSRQLSHWFEKFLVELTTLAAIAASYLLLYPAVRGNGQEALAFLAAGAWRHGAVFAVGIIALSVACAALTLRARPISPILATLIGAGAACMRSPRFRTAAWLHQDAYGGLMGRMILEIVLLAAVLACAVLAAIAVRAVARAIWPRLVWRPTEPAPPPPPTFGGVAGWVQSVMSAGLALVVGMAIALVVVQSSDRGQIIFGLLAGFTVAALLAHRLMPAPHVEAYLACPLVAGIILYALALAGSYGPGPQSWTELPLHARALPVDWLTAGCGGAAWGIWISQRMSDSRLLEAAEAELRGA